MLRSAEDRDRTLNILRTDQSLQGLNIKKLAAGETFGISATVNEQQLLAMQQLALKQNITTLRNSVFIQTNREKIINRLFISDKKCIGHGYWSS